MSSATDNLRNHQGQADTDGSMVTVSRQAVDDTLSEYDELSGALRFILAFYEPGQTYLDTDAWKRAEASGRRALARADHSGRDASSAPQLSHCGSPK